MSQDRPLGSLPPNPSPFLLSPLLLLTPVTFLFPCWVEVLSEVPLTALVGAGEHSLVAIHHFSTLIHLRRGYFLSSESWIPRASQGILQYTANILHSVTEKNPESVLILCLDSATPSMTLNLSKSFNSGLVFL